MFWRRGRGEKAESKTTGPRDDRLAATEAGGVAPAADAGALEAAPLDDEELDDEELDEDELDDDEDDLDADDELETDLDDGDEVTEAGPLPEDMTADLEAQAADFLADNDEWMYGPNAEAVIALLDRLELTGPDAAAELIEAWRATPKVERDVARKAVRQLSEADPEIERRIRMSREAVGNWIAIAADNPGFAKLDDDWPSHCAQAGEAAIDAAAGLVLQEELDEADFDALYAPWAATLGRPSPDATPADGIEGTEGEAASEPEGAADDVEEGEFGPNTDAVLQFLNRLWLLPPEQVARLVSNWERTPREDLGRAHEALLDLVDESDELRDDVRGAQDRLTPWLNAGSLEETSAYLGRTGAFESHRHAGPALADALAALVVGDLLDRPSAELLYAPWFMLVGAPPLPDPAPERASDEDEATEDDDDGDAEDGEPEDDPGA